MSARLRLVRAMRTAVVVLTLLVAASTMGVAQLHNWGDAMLARGWITAFLDSSDPRAVPAPMDRMIVKSGSVERIIYEADARDINLGEPIVSRDGKRLAFPKAGTYGGKLEKYLYVMEVASGKMRRLVELRPPPTPIRGASSRGTQAA